MIRREQYTCSKCGKARVDGPPLSPFCGRCFFAKTASEVKCGADPKRQQWCSTCGKAYHSAWACTQRRTG